MPLLRCLSIWRACGMPSADRRDPRRRCVVRRGGPACPPTRPGRTHRCAPTWRQAGRPLIRHLLRKCHLPPRGKVRRVQEAAPYGGAYFRRGRCPHRPAGGHMGPPLRRRKLHTPQGGLSWPFGPIHLLVRFRLTAKARSFRCSSSPHATRFAGLARGPHNSSPLGGGRPHGAAPTKGFPLEGGSCQPQG